MRRSGGTEEPLVDLTVVGAGELASPRRQLLNSRWRLLHDDLDDSRVTQEVALDQRVREVLLPRVFRVAGAQHRVDPTGRQHGMRVEPRPLPDHHDLGAGTVGGDRRAESGCPGADHEHVGGVGADVHHIIHARPDKVHNRVGAAGGRIPPARGLAEPSRGLATDPTLDELTATGRTALHARKCSSETRRTPV